MHYIYGWTSSEAREWYSFDLRANTLGKSKLITDECFAVAKPGIGGYYLTGSRTQH